MTQPCLPRPEEGAPQEILDAISGAAWERPRIVHHSADALDRGSLRILAGETPIDQKPGGDEGDDSDAAY